MSIPTTIMDALASRLPRDKLIERPHWMPGNTHPISVPYGIEGRSDACVVFEADGEATRIAYFRGFVLDGVGSSKWAETPDLSIRVVDETDSGIPTFVDDVVRDIVSTYGEIALLDIFETEVTFDLPRAVALAHVAENYLLAENFDDEDDLRHIGRVIEILRATCCRQRIVEQVIAMYEQVEREAKASSISPAAP